VFDEWRVARRRRQRWSELLKELEWQEVLARERAEMGFTPGSKAATMELRLATSLQKVRKIADTQGIDALEDVEQALENYMVQVRRELVRAFDRLNGVEGRHAPVADDQKP
jgi:hypothetical protein